MTEQDAAACPAKSSPDGDHWFVAVGEGEGCMYCGAKQEQDAAAVTPERMSPLSDAEFAPPKTFPDRWPEGKARDYRAHDVQRYYDDARYHRAQLAEARRALVRYKEALWWHTTRGVYEARHVTDLVVNGKCPAWMRTFPCPTCADFNAALAKLAGGSA